MNYSEPVRRLPKEHLNTYGAQLDIIQQQLELLDVRAPVEYANGQMPLSTNLPILSDAERSQVGLIYKQSGNAAATKLGEHLVSGDIRQQRIDAWKDYLTRHPQARIMCWRGGQRSRTAQHWLHEIGCDVDRVDGGFKALRTLTLLILDAAEVDPRPWAIVGGRTGTQKTVVIRALDNSIDLEGLANHRGSAFGAHATPQPTPITFEIALACRYAVQTNPALVLEDESRTIGRLALPLNLHARMQTAPIALIDAGLEQRIAHIEREYVTEPMDDGVASQHLENRLCEALGKISRRLGGVRHHDLARQLRAAFAGSASHSAWIKSLLVEYYDPMYDYQLKNKQERVAFRGSREEVLEYLRT